MYSSYLLKCLVHLPSPNCLLKIGQENIGLICCSGDEEIPGAVGDASIDKGSEASE